MENRNLDSLGHEVPSPSIIEELMEQGSVMRLVYKFICYLRDHEGLLKAEVFTKKEDGLFRDQFSLEGVPEIGGDFIHFFQAFFKGHPWPIDVLKDQVKVVRLLDKNYYAMSLILNGEPHILVLDFKNPPTSAVDSISKFVQYGSFWFDQLKQTQSLLYRDDLTGLFNYRYLEVAIDSEIRRCQRFKASFCLLFVDLDNFKPINDSYGHLSGSSVIKQVAEVIKGELREVDSVFRYGGDEFVVLLIETDMKKGEKVAERIRLRIENARFKVEGSQEVHLTASLGVAGFPEHSMNKYQLLKLADDSMYYGKKNGKNRVTLFSPKVENVMLKEL